MKKVLIVNADDCNLTAGVTKAILECYDTGILTSTTFLANLPVDKKTIQSILSRKKLGVGIHLNVTLAKPVSPVKQVKSLVNPDGWFKKVHDQISRLPNPEELEMEYQNQIECFADLFGRMPTHLDTHHQVHDHEFFLDVLLNVAKRNKVPVRRSKLMLSRRHPIKTTDYFFGNLSPEGYWTQTPLETILQNLPDGVSEIMCHPGIVDARLKAISSFTTGRELEFRLLRSSALRRFAESNSVVLSHFGLCYT